MADEFELLILLEEEEIRFRVPRIYNLRFAAFELTDIAFRKCFRLTSAMARGLIVSLDPFLGPPRRSSAVPNGTMVSQILNLYYSLRQC